MNETTTIDYSQFDYGDPLARWFVEEGFSVTDTEELIGRTGEQLSTAGIPLFRLAYFQLIDHPDLLGHAYFWRRGHGVSSGTATQTMAASGDFSHNPVTLVAGNKKAKRYSLEVEGEFAFPVLTELKQEGATDYVVMPVIFSDGHVDVLSVSSDKPGGFSHQELDRMYAMQKLFARMVEIHSLRKKAVNLLDIYVGHQAGEKILKGQVGRGDGETIRAVILFCDMRNFSRLSEELPREEIIALLNDYFECFAGAVMDSHGEVVKFIGDALLAMFNFGEDVNLEQACARALNAVNVAFDRLAFVNTGREVEGRAQITCGLALHVGDIMFGNIGAPGRLDYTVIGPAVNRASRIADLCRDLSQPVLMSEQFVAAVPSAARVLGNYSVRGSDEPESIYVPVARSAINELAQDGN